MDWLKRKWKKIKSDFKASRTIRLAWIKQCLGLVLVNLGYFQDSMPAYTFGALTIGLSMWDYSLRSSTTKKLPAVK